MAQAWGYAVVGTAAVPVRVEAHVRPGLPGMTVVGLPGAAVREARERVRSGASSSGLPLPTQRITVNLSPADVRKESPGFDLPIALAVLAASGHLPVDTLKRAGAVGELALDGGVRPVKGMLPVAEAARDDGRDVLLVPVAALPEVWAVEGIGFIGVASLREAVLALRDPRCAARLCERGRRWVARRNRSAPPMSQCPDLIDVVGHARARRALEIAAAGGHHALLVGTPGAGKTMLARRVPSILAPLSREESLEVTRIWSVAGLHRPELGLVQTRPFRSPHHSASRAAVIGGGASPGPGEASLAHRGVLFLDELPEFARDVLESLRQPLEEGDVTISRAGGSIRLPARFALVAAMNPCPCGYSGHPERECRCATEQIARYSGRLSGPLLDRIDVFVEVEPLTREDLDSMPSPPENSATVRARVIAAQSFRRERVGAEPHGASVGTATAHDGPPQSSAAGEDPSPVASREHPLRLEAESRLDRDARRLVRGALARGLLGGRGFVRTLAVARTLADLDASLDVGSGHVAEALTLRQIPWSWEGG